MSLSFIPSNFVLEMRSLLKLELTHVVRLAGQNNHKDSPSSRIKGTCYVPYIYMGSGTSALAFLLMQQALNLQTWLPILHVCSFQLLNNKHQCLHLKNKSYTMSDFSKQTDQQDCFLQYFSIISEGKRQILQKITSNSFS